MIHKLYKILLIVGLLAITTSSLFSQSSQQVDSEELCDMVKIANEKVQKAVNKIKFELNSLTTKINELEVTLKEEKFKLSADKKQELDLKLLELKATKTKFNKEWFEPDGRLDKLIEKTHELVKEKINTTYKKLNELERLELIHSINNCD